MKKMFIIIFILAIIFVGLLVYRKVGIRQNSINVEEISKIEEYIEKIYMWKEITNEALPVFDDISQADDIWIWEVTKKNLDEYELTYDDITSKAKEIFGGKFDKEFPRTGNSTFIYDEEIDKYIPSEINIDEKEDCFLLDTIKKISSGYEITIIEYVEDYSNKDTVIIRNLQDEELGRIANSDNESKAQEIVKQNKDRFTKKRIILKEEDNLIVEKVEEI